MWPTFFEAALDYLPIQALAVPSERVFSSSAETDTKKHNWTNPVLMESLQMLKFALKKACINFMNVWITSERFKQEQEPKDNLLAALFWHDGEDAMDRIIQDLAEDDSESEEDPTI
jgi:hypothetical protein